MHYLFCNFLFIQVITVYFKVCHFVYFFYLIISIFFKFLVELPDNRGRVFFLCTLAFKDSIGVSSQKLLLFFSIASLILKLTKAPPPKAITKFFFLINFNVSFSSIFLKKLSPLISNIS